jgi:hypothetical protein
MPIPATPFEQSGDVAVATKWTGERLEPVPLVETVALDGEVTYTPAYAGKLAVKRHTIVQNFPNLISTAPAK